MSGDSAAHHNPSPVAYNPSSDSYSCHTFLLRLGFVHHSFFLVGFFAIYIVHYALHLLQITAQSGCRNASRIAGSGMSSALPPSDKASTGLVNSFGSCNGNLLSLINLLELLHWSHDQQ